MRDTTRMMASRGMTTTVPAETTKPEYVGGWDPNSMITIGGNTMTVRQAFEQGLLDTQGRPVMPGVNSFNGRLTSGRHGSCGTVIRQNW